MKGLIRREFILMKKALIISAVLYILALAASALWLLSYRYGNLADMPDFERNGYFEMTRIYTPIIIATIAMSASLIGQNKQTTADLRSGWQKFSYTLPVSEETLAGSKIAVRLILTYAGALLSILGEVFVAAISGTDVHHNMIFLIIALTLWMHIAALEIPAILHFKDTKILYAVSTGIIGLLFLIEFIITKKIEPLFNTRAAEILDAARKKDPAATFETLEINPIKFFIEVLQPYIDTAAAVLKIIFIPIALALIFISYKWTVSELKRRAM